ncbi:MAG: siderophore ABC transporter substrate-binding protein [Bulleidia sp.]
MKKQIAFPAALLLSFSLAACGSSAAAVTTPAGTTAAPAAETTAASDPETITIEALDASESPIELEVPYNPQKLAVMDLAALDVLDNLGLGGRVVGASTTTIDYLSSYNDTAANLGNIKEADMEAVAACEPDLIFIGGRLASSYDALSEIAPVVLLTTDSSLGVVASTEKNAKIIASIFGLEDQVDSLMSDYQSRIDALKTVADGQSAIIGMCTSGSFNIIGNGGRLSLIVNEVGFTNAGEGYTSERSTSAQASASADSSSSSGNPHGTESSFELLPELNPDWIFVMDRDSAIGTNGAKLAAEIMDNEIVNSTSAAQNGHLVILEHPAVWYTAEGGITALGIMISDLEAAMLS